MQDPIITSLQSFPKPDANFVKNKDCLICLESIDVESQKIVGFPCKCANSVYHTDCVVTFLYSGQDKNFCPHCKIKYNLIQPSSPPPPEPIPHLQIHKIKHYNIHMPKCFQTLHESSHIFMMHRASALLSTETLQVASHSLHKSSHPLRDTSHFPMGHHAYS